ncbi:MAG: DUF932 domain-containing protein [Acidimicrobiaceae bacterium]|nr:DUF932 domain-containing protein [Acidimicrobiaceae bacterium]
MKSGRSLVELAQEVQRINEQKRDFVADTREIHLLNGKELNMTGQGEFGITPLGHDQIGGALGIPAAFYDRMQHNHPDVLDHTVNALFDREPKKRLVRVLDGNVRAFLSDRYRRLDNFDLLNVVFPILKEMGNVEFKSMDVTDNRLYLKVVTPWLQGGIEYKNPGGHHPVNDVVQGGIVISNSEVGRGTLQVQTLIYRLVCSNGLIGEKLLTKRHVGGRIGFDDDLPAELFKEDTIKADDERFWLMMRDLVQSAVDETRFQETLRKMNMAASSEPIQDVSAGIKELGKRFDMGEGEQKSVLNFLAEGGDLTQWGALNAITRAAQDVESYDRSTELEEIGGKVLALSASDWGMVAKAR